MASIAVKNSSGKTAGNVDVADELFAVEPNVPVMHQVVTAQLAGRRAGTQSTKTRAEVSGTGKKPFNQKGTGGARQGTVRAPHYPGGGVALGPKPRKYDQKTPKKMIRLALNSALSDRAALERVALIDSFSAWTEPKTKNAVSALEALGLSGKVLVVLTREDMVANFAFRNLENIKTIDAGELNAHDIIDADWVLFTEATLPTAKEVK